MKLSVNLKNCSRSKEETTRLKLEFRDAMLNYCPSVEKLSYWHSKHHFEFNLAASKGKRAISHFLTEKELDAIQTTYTFH